MIFYFLTDKRSNAESLNAFISKSRFRAKSNIRQYGMSATMCHPSISQYCEYDFPERLCHCGAALRNFIRNTMHLKAFQNSFVFITSIQKRVSGSNAYQIALFSAFEKGISNPLIKTALRLSSAKNTLKVV